MTIKALSYWSGSMYQTYQDEVYRWLQKNSADEASFEAREIISPATLNDPDFTWEDSLISDSFLWLTDNRTLLIDEASSIKAPEMNQIIKRLQSLGTLFTVAFVKGSEPVSSVKKALTEDIRERYVPFQDVVAQTEWIISWLDRRDVSITEEDAETIALISGEDVNIQVQVVGTLATAHKGEDLDWEQIEPHLATLGALDSFALPNAIVKGDRERAIESAARVASTFDSAFMSLGLLKKKYRNYAIFVDSPEKSNVLAERLGLNPRAIGYQIREAHTLGRDRIAKSIKIIADTERRFKRDFVTGVMAKLTFEGMASSLAQQFRLALDSKR